MASDPGRHEFAFRLSSLVQEGNADGTAVRRTLRDGVQKELKVTGTAFLAHPERQALRERVEGGSLDDQSYYR